jgi:hypothetical protein
VEKTVKGSERRMQLRKIIIALLALLLAGVVIVPCVSAAENADIGNQDIKIIQVSISNNASEKSNFNGTMGQKIKLLTPVPSSNMKKIKVPQLNQSAEKQKGIYTDRDWEIIRKAMTDLSEKEQDLLITDMKKIQNHTSSLSPDEQQKIITKIVNYIIIATEGRPSVKWANVPGHYQLSMAVSQYISTMTPAHATTLGDYADWADDNRVLTPPLGGLSVNRHSWVLDGTGALTFDNFGPDSALYFLSAARTDFNNYLSDDAYIDIGKSLHYVEDLGCPYHTTGEFIYEHTAYENWVMGNWATPLDMDTALQVTEYYPVTDPVAQSKELAELSHQFLPFFNYKINNDPNWKTDPEMIYYTRNLFAETEKLTIGMVLYANKFESPDTIGSNSVAVNDLQTSYAYINSIGGSPSNRIFFEMNHPDASELEIWVSTRPDSTYNYTDYKVWDRGSIGGSEFYFSIAASGFEDYHDWKLTVKDNAAGNTGSITEFSTYLL